MQKKQLFYNSILILVLQISFYNVLKASEAFPIINNVGNCYFFGRNVYKLVQNTNNFLNPTQERQDQIQNIQEQSNLIKLRKNLVTCLVENRKNAIKKSLEIPSECEHAAFLLGSAGATNEAERIIIAFKNHNN